MKYLSLDTIDTALHPYPNILKCISITIRGTKNLFNIFFSLTDIELSFGVNIPPQVDFTWINTSSGKEKYLKYPIMKRLLYQLKEHHELAEPYLSWVDGLLFSNPTVKPFFRNSAISIRSVENTNSTDDLSDMDDASICSFVSDKEDECFVKALQHKIDHLEYQVELQKKQQLEI